MIVRSRSIALAFGAGLAVLSPGAAGPRAGARSQRPVLTGTTADIPKLQRAVRAGRDDLRARAGRRLPAAGARDRRPLVLRAAPKACCGTPQHARRASRPRVSWRSPAMTSRGALELGAPGRHDRRVRPRRRARRARPLRRGRARAAGDDRPQAQPRRLRARLVPARAARRPRRARRRRCASPSPPAARRRRTAPTCSRCSASWSGAAAARPRRGARSARRSRWCRGFAAAEAGLARLDAARDRDLAAAIGACAASSSGSRCPSTSSRSARPSSPPGDTAARAARRSRSSRRAAAPARRGRRRRRRARRLRGRPRLARHGGRRSPARGWDAGAERARRRRARLGADPQPASRRQAYRWARARARARLARPDLARPRRPLRARRRARRGGAQAAADRARARPRRLPVAGAARSSCAAVIQSGGRGAMRHGTMTACRPCSTPSARTACASPRARRLVLEALLAARRAADRGAARRRRRPGLDLPQPRDARDDRDRAPRAPRPRPRPLRARPAAAAAGRPARAAAARRRCPRRRCRRSASPCARAAGFEAAFTHFPIVGRCADCRAPNLSRASERSRPTGRSPAPRCRAAAWPHAAGGRVAGAPPRAALAAVGARRRDRRSSRCCSTRVSARPRWTARPSAVFAVLAQLRLGGRRVQSLVVTLGPALVLGADRPRLRRADASRTSTSS